MRTWPVPLLPPCRWGVTSLTWAYITLISRVAATRSGLDLSRLQDAERRSSLNLPRHSVIMCRIKPTHSIWNTRHIPVIYTPVKCLSLSPRTPAVPLRPSLAAFSRDLPRTRPAVLGLGDSWTSLPLCYITHHENSRCMVHMRLSRSVNEWASHWEIVSHAHQSLIRGKARGLFLQEQDGSAEGAIACEAASSVTLSPVANHIPTLGLLGGVYGATPGTL